MANEALTVNNRVTSTVRDYLDAYPEEKDELSPLLNLAAGTDSVTSCATMPGHVTCGVVAVDTTRRVLQIRHKALGLWLLPGGHVENDDLTLMGAAMRELSEETGILASSVRPLGELPVDIDVHEIPENAAKAESKHTHYDFRFILKIQDARDPGSVDLQLDEVTDYRWIPASELSGRIGRKVTTILREW
ncbi:hypothetical protein FDG2_4268 [Candidatus Protofrankia californiensis]|uniref:Nudix hydrolase domain-containing protein n=1 Tax=Candidatus Protofrankia californiensis TaxID=1839754 RepID=A0A1C3P4E5_9ACTN|nr:hypothetical protein FDG2_4268 [Candidatus Protofrankia californiensis]